MIIYTHNDCLKKFNGNTHPERKERLESILSSIESSNLKIEFKSLASLLAFFSSVEILANLDICFTVLRSIVIW